MAAILPADFDSIEGRLLRLSQRCKTVQTKCSPREAVVAPSQEQQQQQQQYEQQQYEQQQQQQQYERQQPPSHPIPPPQQQRELPSTSLLQSFTFAQAIGQGSTMGSTASWSPPVELATTASCRKFNGT